MMSKNRVAKSPSCGGKQEEYPCHYHSREQGNVYSEPLSGLVLHT